MVSASRSLTSPCAVGTLPTDEVHLWLADLDTLGWDPGRFRELLSEDEVQRASRYHNRDDWRHFILRRGLLRSILGRYLGVPPAEVRFIYSQYGKPGLDGIHRASWLNFNLSHSADLALFALGRGRRVGVDVERVRTDLDIVELAGRYFSTAERAALLALPGADQLHAFFACWTRKEAFIKASGWGLSFPLDAFDVTLAPFEEARLLAVRYGSENAAFSSLPPERAWLFQHLEPRPGYIGALCVEGKGWRLCSWDAGAFF